LSYCEVGRRIVEFEQEGQAHAVYGEELLKMLGSDLTGRFGRGFSWRNLYSMRNFYLGWEILQTPSAKFQARVRYQKLSGTSDGEKARTPSAILQPLALAELPSDLPR
jgi:hypothetical protein